MGGITRRQFLQAGTAIGFSLAGGSLIIGCAPGGGKADGKGMEVNAVSASSFYHTAFYYAIDNGLFEKRNIKIKSLQQGLGGKEVIQGFASGQIDIAITGVGPQGVFLGKKMPMKILNYLGHSEDTEVVAARPGLTSVADLKGKVVGVSGIGSMSEVLGRIALEQSGFDLHKDAQIKPMTAAQMVQLGTLGQIDAAILWPPYNTTMRSEVQGARALLNVPRVWKEKFKTRRGAPSHGIVVRDELLTKALEPVKAFVQVVREGIEKVQGNHALMRDLIVKWEKFKPELAEKSLQESQPQFSGDLTQEDMDNAIRVWDHMYKWKYMDAPPDRNVFYDILGGKQ